MRRNSQEERLVLIGGIGATINNRVLQVAETWVLKTRKRKKTLTKAERWKSDKQTLGSFGRPSCDSVL